MYFIVIINNMSSVLSIIIIFKGLLLNIEILIDKLIDYYNINTITELAEKLNTSQSTISGWKARNAIGAMTEKVAKNDEKALEAIFTKSTQTNNFQNSDITGSAVDNSQGSSHIFNQNSSNTSYMPDFLFDDLENLFKRCGEDKKDELIDAIDKLTFEFKKKCRG